ncbi:MAG: hypothetical protein IK108_05490, partial [Clostridia bacterium]|nr:hypothetical protein [Clostridia bacterium]
KMENGKFRKTLARFDYKRENVLSQRKPRNSGHYNAGRRPINFPFSIFHFSFERSVKFQFPSFLPVTFCTLPAK